MAAGKLRPGPAPNADPGRLEADVRFLAAVQPPRNAQNVEGLDRAADHITEAFAKTACTLAAQTFQVNHTDYRNIICSFGPETGARVVIGAHYDVSGDLNPGADDNASGVAGLLELARMITVAAPALTRPVDLVAFALEEPPHFRSEEMDSSAYARRLQDEGVPLELMVSVEMIGYFSDQPGSQHYPLAPLSWFTIPTPGTSSRWSACWANGDWSLGSRN